MLTNYPVLTNAVVNLPMILAFLLGALMILLFTMAWQHTMRRKLQESKDRHQAIWQEAVDGLITIGEDGTIETFNPAAEKMFGYKRSEVIGKNVNILMPEPYHHEHGDYLKNYHATGDKKIIGIGREVEAQRRDGSVFPIELSVAEIMLGSDKRIFSGMIRDISERKESLLELQRINRELEKFAYTASHDLKSPLRGIDNLAKWLAADLENIIDEDAKEKLDLMRGRIHRLETILEDILSYSRAGQLTEDHSKIDLNEIINFLTDTIDMPKKYTVTIPHPLPVIHSLRTPIEQIFMNLLTNATKHHDRDHGCINILCEDKGNFYEFIIKDDGPGIPAEFHERVFELFQTLQPRDTTEGSGLGMSIVKKLVEWQGGRVWIVSPEGKRSTAVHFLWPKKHISREVKNAA